LVDVTDSVSSSMRRPPALLGCGGQQGPPMPRPAPACTIIPTMWPCGALGGFCARSEGAQQLAVVPGTERELAATDVAQPEPGQVDLAGLRDSVCASEVKAVGKACSMPSRRAL